MMGLGVCYWTPDCIKINGRLRFKTSCDERWYTSGGLPFHICPFCNNTIWFCDSDGDKNIEQIDRVY